MFTFPHMQQFLSYQVVGFKATPGVVLCLNTYVKKKTHKNT